jgi:hypothetical protein
VIAFLPHILDSSQAERDAHLETIKTVGLKFRGKPFKFMWTQGGDHFDLEEKLGAVGVGYPVITIVYEGKKLFGKLKKWRTSSTTSSPTRLASTNCRLSNSSRP